MSSKKNKLLESAQKNIQKGQYDRAISEYEEIIQLDSADIRHRQRLAELLTKAGRKDEAVKEYNYLAKHYVDNIHYVKAIAVYKQIQKLEPANAEISLTLASLNEKQGLAGNAAAEYTTAIQIYEKNGENLKALKVLESMLALDPQNFAIRLRIAEKYFTTGNEDKSFSEFLSLAKSIKELNDENGLNHVIERTTKIFPKRKAELLAEVADKVEEAAVVTPVVPSKPAPPVTPPPPAAAVIAEPAAPVKQKPVAPVKQEPVAPVKQAPVASARQETAPVKQEPAAAVPPAVSHADRHFKLPDEPVIAELAEDDLIEDILPIADLEELQEEVGAEILSDELDWEEEIDFGELESGATEASVPTAEPEELLSVEMADEEIHDLEEIDLELELELDLEPEIETESSELFGTEVRAAGQEQADSLIDLAKELSLFADEIDFDVMKTGKTDEPFSMDTFASYTKGDLDREDSESHYSLGLAYKEMGLFEDAITEFKVASRSPDRRIDCLILQGLCHRDSGEVSTAVELLRTTLQEPDVTENQLLSIKYELALSHELSGEALKAKQLYTEIVTVRPDFGDSAARLAKLRI